jgi:predicted sugar kinase
MSTNNQIIQAKYADPNNKESAGKSYVIFGKKDSTAVNLSAIGTGGFVINGETERPLSSLSFSPLMTKPPVPLAIADRLTAALSVLPKMT